MFRTTTLSALAFAGVLFSSVGAAPAKAPAAPKAAAAAPGQIPAQGGHLPNVLVPEEHTLSQPGTPLQPGK